ncbi:MAG: aromatic ring-hydroxylating dioxygenase subunit alpha [Steroidobacteraceae bacterium]
MGIDSPAASDSLLTRYPRVAELIQRGTEGIKNGIYPGKVFNDREVYEVERERVFGKAWFYLAHVTEIPNKGDYVLRNIAEDALVLVRGADDVIRAFLNACTHRGVQLCRAEKGNSKTFRCPYHGWTFSNTGKLIGIPCEKEAYGDAVDKSKWGMLEIPKLGIFQGLIFGCLDPDAMPLEDYLGNMKWYLEIMTNRTKGGLEVVGPPQRWIVEGDWKQPADNFVGDSYHTCTAHQSIVEIGLLPPDPFFAMYGELIDMGNGHGCGMTGAPPGIALPPYFGLPPEVVDQAKERLSAGQLAVMKKTNFFHATVFPNFSFLNIMPAKDDVSPPVSMITFRLWQPAGYGKIEIWSWHLRDKDLPEAYKEETHKAYLRTFGISGTFEQDDAEIWQSVHHAMKGQLARKLNFNFQMGHTTLKPLKDWPGPGDAYGSGYNEFPQRGWHRRWLQYMSGNI